MQHKSLMTPEIKAMIGQEEVFSSREEIGTVTIRRFAAAIGDFNPLYWDEEFAKATRYKGLIAPPTMIFELNHNLAGRVSEEDGGYADRINLPPPLSRILRGGNEYEFFQPVRPNDKISLRRKISRIYEKEGKTARLVFVNIDIIYTNEKGELVGINRETFIFIPEESFVQRG
jgi:acyl dehydratase